MDRVDGKTLLKRALRRRCPVCGRGAMFRSHFKINKTCSACNVTFWRDPGEVLGAMYFDWAVAMSTFLLLWAALAACAADIIVEPVASPSSTSMTVLPSSGTFSLTAL